MSGNVTNKMARESSGNSYCWALSRALLLQAPDRLDGDGTTSSAVLQLALSRPSVDGSWSNFEVKHRFRDRKHGVCLWVLDLSNDRFPKPLRRWFVVRRPCSRFLDVRRRRGDRLDQNRRVCCWLCSFDQSLFLKSRTINCRGFAGANDDAALLSCREEQFAVVRQ